MRRCEDCKHSKCFAPAPLDQPDLWVCKARGGMGVIHPVLRALTCRGFESRYKFWRLMMPMGEVTKIHTVDGSTVTVGGNFIAQLCDIPVTSNLQAFQGKTLVNLDNVTYMEVVNKDDNTD